MTIIEPSILSADPANFGEAVRAAAAAGAESLHLDVMDGCFVPNITIGPHVVKALRKVVALPFHVHLMIVEPEKYLETFVEAGATTLTVHQEASVHLHRTLATIRGMGAKAGVALNPGTSLSAIEEVLELTDMILVMTVNPGFGGQTFIHSQLDKIRRLRALLDARGLKPEIGVDGGIDTTTAKLCVQAGATVLAAGAAVYNAQASVVQNLAALRASL
jgi:ribulose-phosphate 3-epimerase